VLARLLSSAGAQRTCRKSEERERLSPPAIWSRVDLPQAAPNISIGRKVRPRSNPKSRSACLRRGRARPGEELPGLRRQERRLGGVYACGSFVEHHGRILTAYERVAEPLRNRLLRFNRVPRVGRSKAYKALQESIARQHPRAAGWNRFQFPRACGFHILLLAVANGSCGYPA